MNWYTIAQYILVRTREPTIVHRGVGAVGGIIAALSLTGPAKWVALIVAASNLLGILMPDSVQSPRSLNDLPPIVLQGRSESIHVDSDIESVQSADRLRVQSNRRPVQVRGEFSSTMSNSSGFGDRD